MRFSMDFLLSLLVVSIIFCGCLSESVKDEISTEPLLDCENTALVSYEPLVSGENSHTVVANVRSIKLNESSECFYHLVLKKVYNSCFSNISKLKTVAHAFLFFQNN